MLLAAQGTAHSNDDLGQVVDSPGKLTTRAWTSDRQRGHAYFV
jgi:hypothetical protein